MTTVLLEPFDNLTAWTLTGTPTIVTGRTATGMTAVGSTTRANYAIAGPSQSAVVTLGFAWRTPALTGRVMCVLASTGNTNEQVRVRCATDGSIEVNNASGSNQATSAAGLIAINTWYYIEVQITLGEAPTGAAVVRLDEVEVINVTGIDTRGAGSPTVYDGIRLGPLVSGSPGPIWDDLYLRTGAGESFMGDVTLPLPPTTVDGTATATVAFGVTATGTVEAPAAVVTGTGTVSVAFAASATGSVLGAVTGTAAVSLVFTAHAVGTRVPAVVVTSGLAEALVEFEDQFGDWVDITCDVRSIDISAGRQQVLEQFRAGTLTLTMANFEGINSAWPPDSIWAQAGPRRTNVPIRVSMVRGGVTHRLFTGTTDAVNDSWPRTVDAMVSVLASDGFKDLARYDDLGQPPARWSDDFEVQESGSLEEAVGPWSDVFERDELGPDWADVDVHDTTAQPFYIGDDPDFPGARAVLTDEDAAWAGMRRTIAGSDFIAVTLKNVFAGRAVAGGATAVTFELYVNLGTDGSCEALSATFSRRTTGVRFAEFEVFRYYADGSRGAAIMSRTIDPYLPGSGGLSEPSSWRLQLDYDADDGVYRGFFDQFLIGEAPDPVGAIGSTVGFGMTWSGPVEGTLADDVPAVAHANGGPESFVIINPWPW